MRRLLGTVWLLVAACNSLADDPITLGQLTWRESELEDGADGPGTIFAGGESPIFIFPSLMAPFGDVRQNGAFRTASCSARRRFSLCLRAAGGRCAAVPRLSSVRASGCTPLHSDHPALCAGGLRRLIVESETDQWLKMMGWA